MNGLESSSFFSPCGRISDRVLSLVLATMVFSGCMETVEDKAGPDQSGDLLDVNTDAVGEVLEVCIGQVSKEVDGCMIVQTCEDAVSSDEEDACHDSGIVQSCDVPASVSGDARNVVIITGNGRCLPIKGVTDDRKTCGKPFTFHTTDGGFTLAGHIVHIDNVLLGSEIVYRVCFQGEDMFDSRCLLSEPGDFAGGYAWYEPSEHASLNDAIDAEDFFAEPIFEELRMDLQEPGDCVTLSFFVTE